MRFNGSSFLAHILQIIKRVQHSLTYDDTSSIQNDWSTIVIYLGVFVFVAIYQLNVAFKLSDHVEFLIKCRHFIVLEQQTIKLK